MKNSGTFNITAHGDRENCGNACVRCAASAGIRRLHQAGVGKDVVAWTGWLVDAGL